MGLDFLMDSKRRQAIEEKITDFKEFLDSFPAEEQLKRIWLEIYSNSAMDRLVALEVRNDLIKKIFDGTENYEATGNQLSKFMERANDCQNHLEKLSEHIIKYIEKAVDASEEDGSDLMDLMQQSKSILRDATK